MPTTKNGSDQSESTLSARISSEKAHVVVIVEENKPFSDILSNSTAPYLQQLIKGGAVAKNYHSVASPSLPNYLALTSGTTSGITSDCNPPGGPCQANVTNIADSMEKAGLSWRYYGEDMPAPCFADNAGQYAVKHDPFMYYPDITTATTRCANHVVPLTQLNADLPGELPNLSVIVPNLCNDMHDCSVQTGDQWLAKWVPQIVGSKAFQNQNAWLVIVWDEGDASTDNVPAVFYGPAVKQGFSSDAYYTHYSLLRTIENAWHLPALTANDAAASPLDDLFAGQ